MTDKVVEDATMAAVYLRVLLAEKVPMHAAVQLTCSYVGSRAIADGSSEKPQEPWEDRQ